MENAKVEVPEEPISREAAERLYPYRFVGKGQVPEVCSLHKSVICQVGQKQGVFTKRLTTQPVCLHDLCSSQHEAIQSCQMHGIAEKGIAQARLLAGAKKPN